jgi:hypothetical protein
MPDEGCWGKGKGKGVISGTTWDKPAQKGLVMKIVVIGGSGLIGSKLVTKLRERGPRSPARSSTRPSSSSSPGAWPTRPLRRRTARTHPRPRRGARLAKTRFADRLNQSIVSEPHNDH